MCKPAPKSGVEPIPTIPLAAICILSVLFEAKTTGKLLTVPKTIAFSVLLLNKVLLLLLSIPAIPSCPPPSVENLMKQSS